MKNKIIFTAVAFMLLFAVTAGAYTTDLSYGLSVLRKEVSLNKCCIAGEAVEFTVEEFEKALGVDRIEAVSINTLPDRMLGVLKLEEEAVAVGQTIERAEISKLCFIPSGREEFTVSFDFSQAGNVYGSYTCNLSMIAGENSSPVASDAKYTTQQNVELIKTLSAYDPDADEIRYELTASSSKGKIRFLDDKSGRFSYTPAKDTTGKDSFSYTVYDKYGNPSNSATVSITIEKPACDVFYWDMQSNPYHNSAIKLAAAGIMTGESIGGVSYFYPDEPMTRATFLRLCMQVTGLELSATPVSATGFADDDAIMSYDKPYVSCAAQSGIVSGILTDAGAVFCPDADISYAEAITIVSRIVGKDGAVTNVFAPEAEGHWARDAYCSLLAQGYIEPCDDLGAVLTRGLGAQILEACLEK